MNEEPTMQERVEEWGITIKAEGGQLVKDSDWAHHEWAVELTGPLGTMAIPTYNMGVGHKGEPPSAAEVLDDMRSEASTFYNGESFEDYCGNFGLNSDSRKEEKRYHAIVASGKQLKAILGDDRFELLMSKTEGL